MASTERATVMAILLAGCASGTAATSPAPRDPAPRALRLRAPEPSPGHPGPPAPAPSIAGGTTAASSPAAGDGAGIEPTAACLAAFDDQRQLYVEVEVHPARRAAFLRTCTTMPPAYQRCASPLHQIEHEAECAAVHDDDDRAAKTAWHRTFELLSDPRPDLPPEP